ncbi:MAG TPA: response regulator [Bryobacteraceae bacterium]|nr:response regulator [Bryobacteraceae bacterium]
MPPFKPVSRKAAAILLVEDKAGDIRLMEEALREAGCCAQLYIARNSQQALAFLRREKPYEASPRPAFILLDVNLPGANGTELLAEIKKERGLRQISVIVLSTSARPEDIAKAYELHANCYVQKPADLESLVEVTRIIGAFWLETAMLACDFNSPPPPLASQRSA